MQAAIPIVDTNKWRHNIICPGVLSAIKVAIVEKTTNTAHAERCKISEVAHKMRGLAAAHSELIYLMYQ